jgi:hypothetical protein
MHCHGKTGVFPKKYHLETNAISVRIYTFQTVQLGEIIDAKDSHLGICSNWIARFPKTSQTKRINHEAGL